MHRYRKSQQLVGKFQRSDSVFVIVGLASRRSRGRCPSRKRALLGHAVACTFKSRDRLVVPPSLEVSEELVPTVSGG